MQMLWILHKCSYFYNLGLVNNIYVDCDCNFKTKKNLFKINTLYKKYNIDMTFYKYIMNLYHNNLYYIILCITYKINIKQTHILQKIINYIKISNSINELLVYYKTPKYCSGYIKSYKNILDHHKGHSVELILECCEYNNITKNFYEFCNICYKKSINIIYKIYNSVYDTDPNNIYIQYIYNESNKFKTLLFTELYHKKFISRYSD